jgi:imidazolonepropionase-like amidohydrolase
MICTVITGASVLLSTGPADVSVRFEDTRITAVAAEVASDGCTVVDGSGKRLTAGFIESATQLGLVEIDLEPATKDANAGGDPIRAAMTVADAYNPRSTLIPIQRIEGVTGAITTPVGGMVSGQGAFVSLAGGSQAETVQHRSVTMNAGIGGESRAQGLLQLRELLDDARAYRANRSAYDRNQWRSVYPGASRMDLEALVPVLDGALPLVVGANRASMLEALIQLQSDLGIRLVIHGAAEGWLVADELAEAGISVIVDPLVYGPGSFGEIHARVEGPALLAAAGVPVMFTTNSSHNARNLKQVAGNAVRGGFDHDGAIRAVTQVPAEVFGLEGRGVIEAGAFADLVLWSGDPLEIGTRVEHVWINGRDVVLESRQTKLRDAYRVLPSTPD